MGRSVYILPQSDQGRQRLQNVKEHLNRMGNKWIEISTDDITCNNDISTKDIYVVDPLQGVAYQKLIDNGCRVYGVGALVSSLSLKVPLDHKKPFHKFGGLASMALLKKKVCFTNIKMKVRENSIKKAMQMGAEVSCDMSDNVTHLVVGEINSNKYVLAHEHGITTVTLDWLNELWTRSVEEIEPIIPEYNGKKSPQFEEITRNHTCPIFYGAIICCSNASSEDKNGLAKIITENGGVYSPAMDKKTCTHLILGIPGGKKHIYAIRWGLSVANPQWITDSVTRGFAQHIDQPQYRVNPPAISSDTTTGIASRIEETASDTILGGDNFEAEIEKMLGEVNRIDIEDDLLDGNRFFISGFNRRHASMIEKIVKDGGGYVFQKLSASVGHIICSRTGINTNPDIANYRKMTGPRPFVVDFDWVYEAVINALPPEPDQFLIFDGESEILPRQIRKRLPKPVKQKTQNHEHQSALSVNHEQPDTRNFNTLSDSTCNETTEIETENGTVLFAQTARNASRLTKKSEVSHLAPSESSVIHESTVDNELGTGLFRGLTFVINCESSDNLNAEIVREKGIILELNQISNAQYILSDKSTRHDYHGSWKHASGEVLTFEWARNSLEKNSLLPTKDYRVTFMPPNIFYQMTFSLSGYDPSEKQRWSRVIESCGGECSSRLDRNNTDYLVASKPDGKKYDAAKNWKDFKIVSVEWITAISNEYKSNPNMNIRSVPLREYHPGRNCSSNDITVRNNFSTPHVTKKKSKMDLDQIKANYLETPESERDPTVPDSAKMGKLIRKFSEEITQENMRKKNIGPFSKSEKKRKEDQKKIMRTPATKKTGSVVLTGKKQLLPELSDEIEDEDVNDSTSETDVRITPTDTLSTSSMMEPVVDFESESSKRANKRASTELDNRNNSLEENRDPDDLNTTEIHEFEKQYEQQKQQSAKKNTDQIIRPNFADITSDSSFGDRKRRKKSSLLQRRSTLVRSFDNNQLRDTTNDGLPEIGLKYEEKDQGEWGSSPHVSKIGKKNSELRKTDCDVDSIKSEDLDLSTWRPIFVLSQVTEKSKIMKDIEMLKGIVVNDFESVVSVCIVGKLTRNEKILSSLASGAIILPARYVTESVDAQKWLNPVTFDVFFDEDFDHNSEKDRDEAKYIYEANQHWKKKYYPTENPMNKTVDKIHPFQNWKVSMISSDPKKMAPFENIIHSGSGEVIQSLGKNQLESAEFEGTTHVIFLQRFTNSPEYKLRICDLFEKFSDAGLESQVVVTEDMISEKLLAGKKPNTKAKSSSLSAYAKYLENL